MAPETKNGSLIKGLRRDLAGYLMAAAAGVIYFLLLITIFGIIIFNNRTFPSWGIPIYLFIFVSPAILSGALSVLMTRTSVNSARDAAIFGAFSAAVFGGLFFILALVWMFGFTTAGRTEHALNEYLNSILLGIFFLLLLQAFFAIIGAAAGAVTSKLLFFRASRNV